jgi:hypothetical protein
LTAGDGPVSSLTGTEEGFAPAAPRHTSPSRRDPYPLARKNTIGYYALIFLIPYSVLMTVVAMYFYFKVSQTKHPLEYLPDWPGENPGVTRKGQGKTGQVYERISPTSELPSTLRVGLNKTIRIGNLEVTPEKVEQRKIMFCYDSKTVQREPSQHEALVLTLRLKNVSVDEVFYPTDPAFARQWHKGETESYTFLQVGSKNFFGGPIPWTSLAKNSKDRAPRQFLDGQNNDNRPLQPDEERSTIIATDPSAEALLPAIRQHKGLLVWRVQLRRGLVRYKDREVSASAVVGVDFSEDDIRKPVR